MPDLFDVTGLSDEEVGLLLGGRDYTRHGNLASVGDWNEETRKAMK
jgi:hypothetical protein